VHKKLKGRADKRHAAHLRLKGSAHKPFARAALYGSQYWKILVTLAADEFGGVGQRTLLPHSEGHVHKVIDCML